MIDIKEKICPITQDHCIGKRCYYHFEVKNFIEKCAFVNGRYGDICLVDPDALRDIAHIKNAYIKAKDRYDEVAHLAEAFNL